jgi:cell division septation protein DedD
LNAILKAKEIKPDIILADVFLPDKDGYEVSREIKDDSLLKDTIVILLSASLGLFDETKAAEAGADDFIIKPFGSAELAKRLESLVGKEELSEVDGKAGGKAAKSLISQYGKVKFASMVVVPIVIFMIAMPILYKNLPKFKSKLTKSSNPLSSKADPALQRVELKPKTIVKGLEEKILVTVNDKREIFIENRKYTLSELKTEIPMLIKSHGKEIQDEDVSLKAGADVPYSIVMEAIAEIKKTGVKNVERVTGPVLVFESGRPGSGEIYREKEIKASQLEKSGVSEELEKVEAGKEKRLGKEQRPKVGDDKRSIKAIGEGATKKDVAIVPIITPDGKYAVQIGAFRKEEEAKGVAKRLKSKGYPAYVKTGGPGQGAWYKVRIGLFKTRGEAKLYGDNLKGRKPLMKKVVVVVEEEKPEEKKDVAVIEASSSGKGNETQEDGGYLAGIKISDWSIYVAWCVPTVYHITIENANDMAYRDIKVRVRYRSASYYNAGTTEIGESKGILHITLPPHSKKTYLEKGVSLAQGSVCGMNVGSGDAGDMEVLEAIPASYSDHGGN